MGVLDVLDTHLLNTLSDLVSEYFSVADMVSFKIPLTPELLESRIDQGRIKALKALLKSRANPKIMSAVTLNSAYIHPVLSEADIETIAASLLLDQPIFAKYLHEVLWFPDSLAKAIFRKWIPKLGRKFLTLMSYFNVNTVSPVITKTILKMALKNIPWVNVGLFIRAALKIDKPSYIRKFGRQYGYTGFDLPLIKSYDEDFAVDLLAEIMDVGDDEAIISVTRIIFDVGDVELSRVLLQNERVFGITTIPNVLKLAMDTKHFKQIIPLIAASPLFQPRNIKVYLGTSLPLDSARWMHAFEVLYKQAGVHIPPEFWLEMAKTASRYCKDFVLATMLRRFGRSGVYRPT